MELIQTKFVEKIKTHIFDYVTFFFFFENRAVYEIMWKNIAQWGMPQMIKLCMGISCWIPKATNAHTRYIILSASLLQKWFHKRASILRYTYISYIVNISTDDIGSVASVMAVSDFIKS